MAERTPQRDPAAAILLRPFATFFRLEAASGILLLLSAVVALVWANSGAAASYFAILDARFTVDVGGVGLSKPLLLWINDGLMAIFFFVVGLEIKREVLVGELSSPKNAALSVAAAVGGMAVPALVYVAINSGGPGAAGWGVPMATDIAFALGVLALLGRRVPTSVKIFVTALAIVDDIGAVLVIALFYTAEIAWIPLLIAAGVFALLVLANRFHVRRVWVYALLGACLWVAFLKSGVHATIAGILVAFTIPARRLVDAPEFLRRARLYLDEFEEDLRPGQSEPTADQRDAIHSLEVMSEQVETPLTRLEHSLHPFVAFLVMPVFALANAGVRLVGADAGALVTPLTTGVVVGLFVGKQIGVFGASWLAVRMGIARLPSGVGWGHIWGASLLAGIGFTMSLFIASLAFADPALLDQAKLGILAGSLVAGVVGALVLVRVAGRGSGLRSETTAGTTDRS